MKKVFLFSMFWCLCVSALSAQDNAKKKDPTLGKSTAAQNRTAEEVKKQDERKKQRAASKMERSFENLSPDQKKVALINKKN